MTKKQRRRGVAVLVLLLLAGWTLFRLMPFYLPSEAVPFIGAFWYNPYEGLTRGEGKWLRTNFHAHSNAWGKMANGSKNTVSDIMAKYDSLGYDIIGISDYQHITATPCAVFIPVYEHGFNIMKTHQGSLGAREEYGRDVIIPQTRSQKQHIINALKERSELVVLNHPGWMGGYSVRNMQQLTGYDLIEVLNDFWKSENLWDVALSSGKPAMIMAGDDAHNVFKPTDIARDLTMIYVRSGQVKPQHIYDALKNGTAYGLEVTRRAARSMVPEKRRGLDSLPVLQSCIVRGDSLCVLLTGKALEYTFIGQDGIILSTVSENTAEPDKDLPIIYKLQPQDTYVRVRILLRDSSLLYLNPVMRTAHPGMKPPMPEARKRQLFTIFAQ